MMNRETSIRKRKYSEEFFKYGFTFIVEAGIEKPQYVICNKIMSAESMKPNKMKRHFDAKHPNFAGKEVQYFKNKADGVKKNRLDFGGKYQQQNMAAIETSYLVALRIAKAKKPHTIAKELLLPATKDIVRALLGAEYVKRLNTISLSNNTVSRRIEYPVLFEIALRLILPFPTTYLCETGFSSLLVIKSKYRSRLVTENDLHCSCKDCSKDFRSGEKEASTPFSLTLFGFRNSNFFVVKI